MPHCPEWCVMVPLTEPEIPRLSLLFYLWASYASCAKMHGRAFPYSHIRLLITYPSGSSRECAKKINQRVRSFGLHKLFGTVSAKPVPIPANEDIYIRDYSSVNTKSIPRLGLKSGPNIQFFRSMELVPSSCHFVLLNECDAYPLVSDWPQQIEAAYAASQDSIVIGAKYTGRLTLCPTIQNHINGNAIYCLNHRLYSDGLLQQWEKGLEMACLRYPDTAYDILFERVRNCDGLKAISSLSITLQQALSKFTISNVISNRSLPLDKPKVGALSRLVNEGCAIIHGSQFKMAVLEECINSCGSADYSACARSQLFLDSDAETRALLFKGI